MKMPLRIDFRDVPPLASLEDEIRRRAARLDHWSPDVTSCHVAVEAEGNRHRVGHAYRLHLRVGVVGGEIAVTAQPGDEDIHRAVRAAFEAAYRQLADHQRRRRGQTKLHRPAAGSAATDRAGAPR